MFATQLRLSVGSVRRKAPYNRYDHVCGARDADQAR